MAQRIALLTLWLLFQGAGYGVAAQKPRAHSGVDQVRTDRIEALRNIVAPRLEASRARLAVAQRSGNVSDLSAARRQITLFEQLLETLGKTGELTFPDQVRRELAPIVDEMRMERDAIAARFAVELQIVADESADGVADELQTGQPAPPPAVTPGQPPVVPTPDTDAAPTAARYPGNVEIASSGASENWITLGTLFVEVHSLEVARFSLLGVDDILRMEKSSPVSGAPIQFLYVPQRPIGAQHAAFRVLSVEGRPGATVLAWPSARNQWALEIRCRPEGAVPSQHAVLIQACGAKAELAPTPTPDAVPSTGATQASAVEVADADADADAVADADELQAGQPAAPPAITPDQPTAGPTPVIDAAPAAVRFPGNVEIASNGTSENWVTLGTLYIEVHSLEVASFSLLGVDDILRVEKKSPATGLPIQLLYVPQLPIDAQHTTFRALSVEGRPGATVFAWPSARNQWTLEIRCRPEGAVPSQHAVLIQACGAKAEPAQRPTPGAVRSAGSTPAGAGGKIAVSIETQPPGATVRIDGVEQRVGDVSVRTPCIVEIDDGMSEIVLRLPFFQDASVKRVAIKPGVALRVRLEPDTRFRRHTLQVPSVREWTRSGVRVARGELVNVVARGRWSAAPDRRFSGPEGFPETVEFAVYYRDTVRHPRQFHGAPYGALVARVGAEGPIRTVGAGAEFTADQAGELLFDINERVGPHRLDNTGAVTVEIVAGPGR